MGAELRLKEKEPRPSPSLPLFGVTISPANRFSLPPTASTGLYPPEVASQPLVQPPVAALATTFCIFKHGGFPLEALKAA